MHLSVRDFERRSKDGEKKTHENTLKRLHEEELRRRKNKKVAKDTKEVSRKKSLMDGKQVCIPTLCLHIKSFRTSDV